MPLSVKDAGVWKQAAPSAKDAGVWKTVNEGHVRDAGVWKKFHSAGEYIGTAEVNSTTVNTPAETLTGDLLIVMATRTASNVVPTLAGGWTSLQTVSALTRAARLAYRTAASDGAQSIGTWTNANYVRVLVYRGFVVGQSSLIFPEVAAGAQTQSFSAFTFDVTDGSSWYAAMHQGKGTRTVSASGIPLIQMTATNYSGARSNSYQLTNVASVSAADTELTMGDQSPATQHALGAVELKVA